MTANTPKAFNITDWLEFRNGRASCPCCEIQKGKLNSNLSLVPGSNGAYKCHAGHTPAEIRSVLGASLHHRPSSLSDSLPRLGTKSPHLVPDLPNRDFTVDESYVRRSVERLLHHQGSPQQKALAWLEGRGFTGEMIEHYQLGLEQLTVKPDKNNPEKKEIYWAIAIFIPVPGRTGRYYKKMRVAPWFTGDERPDYLSRWSQYGVPTTIWFTHLPSSATQTWFAEGEWDAMRLGWIASSWGEKVAIACSTGGCGAVPHQDQLEKLPGLVTIFYDRNDEQKLNGTRSGDEGALKLASALAGRGRVALVPMPDDCDVKGWDVSNALDDGFGWSDFEKAAAAATVVEMGNVTSDTTYVGDTKNPFPLDIPATVTAVTALLRQGLKDWEEQAHLDALQSKSLMSKASFWQLVASHRCHSDEVMPIDEQQLGQLIEWKNVTLDFQSVLPHLASDLLHDGRVLNIDPIMLWQYLLPATLSLVGKKVDLDVGSHRVPAIAWTCSVGESGTGKSRAEGLILSPLLKWQEEEYHRFKAEWEQYKASPPKKGEENGEAVAAPVQQRKFLFEVATIQAVMRRLSEQGSNGSLWARDEIAGLFKSLGQFTASGEGEGLECLLPMWDGTSAPVDRVLHEDSYYLADSRLSIAGGLQPGVFRKIFTDPDDAQGLQARFLFALPKVQPALRVKGYCHLAELLPEFYRWVDTQFPHGTIKLSRAADARYDAVYEDIGRSAESAQTPAIRAWMRKLPGQLLRIALTLHIIECYHEPGRPKHEIHLDTLNRAVDFCRYYRSVFQVVQQSTSDSDAISSILLKIWDLAATSPSGLAVRDAYRSIKALQRRAKELGRNVASYTIDLYSQLEKMGRGTVQRCGRLVRFVVSTNSPSTTPSGEGGEPVTVVTVTETQVQQAIDVSPIIDVSSVTIQDSGRLGTDTVDIDVPNLSTPFNSSASPENSVAGNAPDDAPFSGGMVTEIEKDSEGNAPAPGVTTTTQATDDGTGLLIEKEMADWHSRLKACQTLNDAIDFDTSLDALSLEQRHQFESSLPEDTWAWLWNLPEAQEPEPESVPEFQEALPPEPESMPEQTLEQLKALLLACDSLVQLNELKRKHKKNIALAYSAMSEKEQATVDALAALAVPHRVFKYMGDEIGQGAERLMRGMLVYIDPAAKTRSTALSAPVWAIDGVTCGWKRAINVSLSLLKSVVKDVLPSQHQDGGEQIGLI